MRTVHRLLGLLTILLSVSALAQTSFVFAPAVSYPVESLPYSVCAADVDGDGHPDLISANYGSNTVSVLKSLGDGTFDAAVTQIVGQAPTAVCAADLDGDGHVDLAATYLGDGTDVNKVAVLKGDGTGSFAIFGTYAVGNTPMWVRADDLNGDGKPDLSVVNRFDNTVSVLQNNGDGTFAPTGSPYAVGSLPWSVTSADMDGDGYPDLAVSIWGANAVAVLKNNGDGTFAAPVEYGVANNPIEVTAVDVNADGHPDLVAANAGSNEVNSEEISVLKNNGDGTFTTAENYLVGTGPISVQAADLDGDGDPDLAVANHKSNSVSILSNGWSGIFTPVGTASAGAGPHGACSADFDGDGAIDLAVVNYYTNDISVLLNRTIQGLVACYPMDGDAIDATRNGHDGTIHGVDFVADRFTTPTSAAGFVPAQQSHIDLARSSSLILNDQFTISFWMLYGGPGIIIEKDVIGTYDSDWHVRAEENGIVKFGFGTYGNVFATRRFDDGQWHNVAIVRNRTTGVLAMYLDGMLDVEEGDHFNDLYGTADIRIGAMDEPGGLNQFFSGSLDDVQLYNRALSASEVAQLVQIEPSSDSLLIPSASLIACDTTCLIQPVQLFLTQPIKGATIALKIPAGVHVCGVSRDSLLTSDWDIVPTVIREDSGFISLGLLNTHGATIPVGTTTVFNVLFSPYAICNTTTTIHWDTALSADIGRQLKLTNTLNRSAHPGFDVGRDSTRVVGYIAGDFDGSEAVDISDLQGMVDFLFFGGAPAVCYRAADPNGDSVAGDISDLSQLVDYLFFSGSLLCYGVSPVPPAEKAASTPRICAQSIQGETVISLESVSAVRGLQLLLTGAGSLKGTNLVDERLELLVGRVNDTLRVGLLDLNGRTRIPAGTQSLIRLDGEYQIIKAMVSDEKHQTIVAAIGAAEKESTLPTSFAMSQNYPNPFNPNTQINFDLPVAARANLSIYNLLGQQVRVLVDGSLEAGSHTVDWDGRASNGQSVASGVYLYRLQAGEFSETRKMMMLK